MDRNCAPIAMFVYNRLDNVMKTIECLTKNTLADDTELYVFSDGGKDEASWQQVYAVRNFFRTGSFNLKKVTLIEREVNYYLERNIIEGISQILSDYDRVIVLEDDICTSPYFLEYMNDALDFYKDTKRVMHISGFTHLDVPYKGDVYFTRHMAGWGWATWADRWNGCFVHFKSREEALRKMTPDMIRQIEYGGRFHCLESLDRNPIPWDICWNINIRTNNGLCLSPTQTLVRNCGINNGTHFHSMSVFGHYEYDRDFVCRKLDVRKDVVEADDEVENQLNPAALTDHGFRYNLLGKIVRFFYVRFIKPKSH